MSEPLSRDEAREIVLMIIDLAECVRRGTKGHDWPMEPERNPRSVEGRALKLLAKLSQPQSPGSPQE
jgi:hypothetical protein